MATTNLNLTELSTSDLLSAFPSAFNANMQTLDNCTVFRTVASANIDSINVNGFYRVTGSIALIIHIQWDVNYAMQIANDFREQRKKTRFKISGTWGAWHYDGGDLLWTNPSPSTAFEAQTITTTISLSNYRFIEVAFLSETGIGYHQWRRLSVNADNLVEIGDHPSGLGHSKRSATVSSSSGIAFSAAYYYTPSQYPAADNSKCIPYAIYGIV